MRYYLIQKLISGTIPLVGLIFIDPCMAQSITPALDGTNTIVNQVGNQYVITGGNISRDGLNQFHSFSQFGLQFQENANFPANPTLQNILARITGGNPTIINGLIQVTGGSPNLFLINPSGIIFGMNASLNVPGSFTATTANGISFGNQWFNGIGSNHYDALIGTPTTFAFTMGQPGAIVNLGNLSVNSQQALALLGGTVVSTGTLIAPGGQVIVAAVPGGNWVRLSQSDSPLSLEIQPLHTALNASAINSWTLPIATLPQLLTGGNLSNANHLAVNANGTVELSGSGLNLEAGDVSVRSLIANNAILNANRNITLFESQLQTSQTLTLLANDTVRLRDSQANQFLAKTGGNFWIQGNQQVDILTLNHLAAEVPLQSGGNLTLVSNGIVSGDAHFKSDKNFSILTANGQGGTFVSLFDPIIYVQGDFNLASYTGVSLKVQAGGNISLGDVTIIAPDFILDRQIQGNPPIPSIDPDITLLSTQKSLILRTNNGSINVGNIIAQPSFDRDRGAAIVLSATQNITTGSINAALNQVNNFGLPVQGGAVTLETGGDITVRGPIDTFFLGNNASNSAGGAITISTQNGSIRLFDHINTAATNFYNASPLQNLTAQGGNVTLQAGTPSTFGNNIGFDGYINAAGTAAGTLNRGLQGSGGVVQILAQGVVRGLGQLSGVTIDASGSTRRFGVAEFSLPGKVLIQQDGGAQNRNFAVADRSIINDVGGNGLVGSITTGIDVANNRQIPVGSSIEIGNTITLRSINRPPNLTITSPVRLFRSDQPIHLTYEELAPIATDNDHDVLSPIYITKIPAEGELLVRKGGNAEVKVKTGMLLGPGDELIYQPTPTSRGEIEIATLATDDRVTSTSVPLKVQVELPINASPCQVTQCLTNDVPIAAPAAAGLLTPSSESDILKTGRSLETDILLPTAIDLPLNNRTLPEDTINREFEDYFNLPKTPIKRIRDQQEIVRNIEQKTKLKPAFIYLNFVSAPERASDQDPLEILIISGHNPPIRKQIPEATRGKVVAMVKQLRNEVSDPLKTDTTSYLKPAQQLYYWLMAPLSADLATRKVNSLVFLADLGLRSLPFAVMHDGHQFLLEKYSIGLMPSVSLTDISLPNLTQSQILGVGISDAIQNQPSLPGVLAEILMLKQQWAGKTLLNQTATLANLKTARRQYPYNIVHIATHAAFPAGDRANAYIQLWDGKLHLAEMRQLDWHHPPVELLILSACSTAIGDRDAELGFAGVAIQTGVKSVIASLWQVNDLATTALISRFYTAIKASSTKAAALQQAQLAMLRGELSINHHNTKAMNHGTRVLLEQTNLAKRDRTFSHPYYWSAFTIVGNPW